MGVTQHSHAVYFEVKKACLQQKKNEWCSV